MQMKKKRLDETEEDQSKQLFNYKKLEISRISFAHHIHGINRRVIGFA